MITTFISHAAGRPIALFFKADDQSDSETLPGWQEALTALVEAVRAGAWWDVTLVLRILHPSSPLLRLLTAAPQSKPTLQRLNLKIRTPEQSASLSDAIAQHVDFEHAPILSSLHIDIPGERLTNLKIPWDTLASLSLGSYSAYEYAGYAYDFTASHAYQILQKCPNLFECHIHLHPLNQFQPPTLDGFNGPLE